MDFHTAPIIPLSPQVTNSDALASSSASEAESSQKESTLVTSDSQSSVFSPDDQTTDNRFEGVRNLPDAHGQSTRAGLSELPKLSIKQGDWRAFSKVQAKLVVWNKRGVVGLGGLSKRREDENVQEEWVIDGSLWILKLSDEIVFLPQTSAIPIAQPITSPYLLKTSRRLSLTLSRTLSGNARPSPPTPPDHDAEGKGMASIMESIKSVFKSSDKKDKSAENGGLTRTRTREKDDAKARRKSASSVKDNPILESPLPAFQNEVVTALTIKPCDIHALRYTAPSTTSSPSSPGANGSLLLDIPARVELDVTSKVDKQGDAGVARDVTVAFCFPEALLADEAEHFKQRIEELRDD